MKRLTPRRIGDFNPIIGQKKGLIILVNFSDVAFKSENDNTLYQRIANEEHFSDARSRLEEDIGIFHRTMPMQKNISGVKIRDIPFEKTTTMKIKRYLLKQG